MRFQVLVPSSFQKTVRQTGNMATGVEKWQSTAISLSLALHCYPFLISAHNFFACVDWMDCAVRISRQ